MPVPVSVLSVVLAFNSSLRVLVLVVARHHSGGLEAVRRADGRSGCLSVAKAFRHCRDFDYDQRDNGRP